DEILVGIGVNSTKKYFFPLETRLEMLRAAFKGVPNVSVHTYEGLTVKFAQAHAAQFLLRGLRTGQDLDYERGVALINQKLAPEMETVFLTASGAFIDISSTLVREIVRYHGDPTGLVPEAVAAIIAQQK
ncbi:MAG: pantetheine-phosphate adenylyltransferase, partial [Bacteroidota bacterium]